ncbi:MAG TPA: beta-eliminating lyase-related protein [Steroidobacteraceae bacterium]|nr:beta-eliminating lyase-related protein [Steroidobacteraceae bacterium]
MNFLSDNTAAAAPEVLAAVAAANQGPARAYGADAWSARIDAVFSHWFGHPVRAFPVATGTAANALALAAVTPPWGQVFCGEHSHVAHDECGAVELQTGGARLTPLPAPQGLLEAEVLLACLADNPVSVHSVQPAGVSITQASECGTVYGPDEIGSIAAVCRQHGLKLHMDGARFANALVSLGVTPAEITWQAGVDVLSFGATKNGALGAEAVVFFDPALARDFELRRKRAAHLFSKMRYLSAQLLACLEGEFFLAGAARANGLAARIGSAAGARLLYPVHANAAFLRFAAGEKAALRARGFSFHDWGAPREDRARFVVAWDQPEGDVDALCEALAQWS